MQNNSLLLSNCTTAISKMFCNIMLTNL